jgi:hypothetical protein
VRGASRVGLCGVREAGSPGLAGEPRGSPGSRALRALPAPRAFQVSRASEASWAPRRRPSRSSR